MRKVKLLVYASVISIVASVGSIATANPSSGPPNNTPFLDENYCARHISKSEDLWEEVEEIIRHYKAIAVPGAKAEVHFRCVAAIREANFCCYFPAATTDQPAHISKLKPGESPITCQPIVPLLITKTPKNANPGSGKEAEHFSHLLRFQATHNKTQFQYCEKYRKDALHNCSYKLGDFLNSRVSGKLAENLAVSTIRSTRTLQRRNHCYLWEAEKNGNLADQWFEHSQALGN